MTRDLQQYRLNYVADYGFESVMVRYRQELLVERLHAILPRTVLEIGCGTESLYKRFLDSGGRVDHWLIVEPIDTFCEIARGLALPHLEVLEGEAEECTGGIRRKLKQPPDMIVCSGLLHEVTSPERLLGALVAVMDERSVVHVNVPNSGSMHRRLALEMGLIESLEAPSVRNQQLLQNRVYDANTLASAMAAAGLLVTTSGGYMIKPFTHATMEAIAPSLGDDVLSGLNRLGRSFPDLASEIFAEGRRR